MRQSEAAPPQGHARTVTTLTQLIGLSALRLSVEEMDDSIDAGSRRTSGKRESGPEIMEWCSAKDMAADMWASTITEARAVEGRARCG